jgi:hypothetical protein
LDAIRTEEEGWRLLADIEDGPLGGNVVKAATYRGTATGLKMAEQIIMQHQSNATAHLPPASGGKVPPDVRHPSGFASWQDLSGYLRDYGISSDDDHTCGLIEQAYNHWPNAGTEARGNRVASGALLAEESKGE